MGGAKGLFLHGFAIGLSEIGVPFDAVGDVSWDGMYVDERESNHGMSALILFTDCCHGSPCFVCVTWTNRCSS